MPDRLETRHLARAGRSEACRILGIVALCLVLFFSYLGTRPLWNQDEGTHAATSKDMVLSGDWTTPMLNGEPFFDKPAFHNWLVALSFLGFGFTEFAARLPNAMLGLGCVLLTYLLGRRLFGPSAGFLGAVVLATTAEFFVLSRTVMHDISLTFFVTLGLALWFVGYSKNATERRWFLLSYAAFGGAMLAKGPIGVLLPGAVVFLFLLGRRELGFLGRMSLGWGLLIGLAVAAPWYLMVSLRNPDYARYFFIELNFGSFFSEMSHHPEPFHYYVPSLLAGFFPWSIFLPVALVRAWQRRGEASHGGTVFSLLWAGLYFAFFSLAESKLSTYILPVFPPLALLVGRLWHELATAPTSTLRKAVLWSFAPFLALPGAVILYVRTHPLPLTELAAQYGLALEKAATPLVVLTIGLAVAFVLVLVRRTRAGFTGVAFSFAAFIALFAAFIVPLMSERRSSHEMTSKLDELLPDGEPIVCYSSMRGSALFYSDRPVRLIKSSKELNEFLSTDGQVYFLISSRRYREMGLEAPIVYEIGADLLISNRRAAEP
jgi:4-amino-4-deoxy-L-arabinose transferase-like glycosyltransferase